MNGAEQMDDNIIIWADICIANMNLIYVVSFWLARPSKHQVLLILNET